MKSKNIAIALMIVLVIASGSRDQVFASDDKQVIIQKFYDHLQTVYMEKLWENGHDPVEDKEMMAMVLGYALGQQLRYIKKGTPEHRLWKAVEDQVYADIDNIVEMEALNKGFSPREKQSYKDNLLGYLRVAEAGARDDEMKELTGVAPGEAPSIFADVKVKFTVTDLAGTWKMARGDYCRSYYPKRCKEYILSDSISAGGYLITPEAFQISFWKLEDQAIVFYDANGQKSYRFEQRKGTNELDIWKGVRYHRGELYEEMKEVVEYYLTRPQAR